MKAAAYAEARAEIDLLRGRYYGRTQAVLKANSRIDECLLEIAKKGGEQLLKAGKEQKYQKMLDRMSEEQGLLKKGQVDIVARLNKIDDAFQRNIHLGSVYAAVGDLKASTERYLEAKRIGDTTLRRESWPTLGIAYAELFRNAILSKDKPRAQAIKNEASSRFVDPDNKTAEEKWWVDLRKTLEDWSENTFPQEEKRVTRLRDEVRASPDDPQRHWALAVCLMDSLGNLFEARGLFAYIQDNHHDFPQVANGNCLYRLAEIHFAAREIPQAIKRYTELQQQYKDNPKVMDGNSSSGVRRRLEDCYRLLNRMGYARDKSGK
jgi:tetratricopeptide (TPR) repeat protein